MGEDCYCVLLGGGGERESWSLKKKKERYGLAIGLLVVVVVFD